MFVAPLEYGVTFWRNLRVSQAFFLGGYICMLSSSVQASVAKSRTYLDVSVVYVLF